MTIVIAASQGPFREMARRLNRPGRRVVFIGKKSDFTAAGLARIRPDYVFLPHWSFIIPAQIYSAYECVIFHMTDVPYGRGGTPLQNLILRGHDSTKISALRCISVIDGGPVYLKRPLSLTGSAGEIYERAARTIESMMIEICRRRPQPVPQRGRIVRFTRRNPAQSDFSEVTSLKGAYDFIRMLDADGYPRAFVEKGNIRIEFSNARLGKDGLSVSARIMIARRKQ